MRQKQKVILDPELTLRPIADGDYAQFVEVPNSGFIVGDQLESGTLLLTDNPPGVWSGTLLANGTVIVENVNPHHGTYNIKADITVAGASNALVYRTFNMSNVLYVRLDVKFEETCPTVGNCCRIIRAHNIGSGATIGSAEIYNDAGTVKWSLVYRHAGGYYRVNATSGPVVGTVYRIVLKTDCSTADGTLDGSYEMWVNGVSVASVSGKDTDAIYVDRVYVGRGFSADTTKNTDIGTSFIDCVVISSSPIDLEDRDVLVSDQSDDTALQVTASVTQKEALNLADTQQTGPINSVTAYMRAKAVGADPAEQAVILWRTHSADYESSAISISRAAFTNYSEQRTKNPNTGLDWTWAEVNSLQIGARPAVLAAGETIIISEFWIVVNYVEEQEMSPYLRRRLVMRR